MIVRFGSCFTKALCAISFAALVSFAGAQPTIEVIGSGVGYGLSPDGLTVTGQDFVWRQETGKILLGGISDRAIAATFDGAMVVGGRIPAGDFRWCTWDALGQLALLPTINQYRQSIATCVSWNGSVIGGTAYDVITGLNTQAVTFSAGQYHLLGLPYGATTGGESEVTSISSDGSVVFCKAYAPGYGTRAYRWTSAGGFSPLNPLPDGALPSFVSASTPDGKYTVGTVSDGRAFRSVNGAVNYVPGLAVQGWGITDDGNTVVGGGGGNPETAFLWNPVLGTCNLKTLLTSLGADTFALNFNGRLSGMSHDGRYIGGNDTARGVIRITMDRVFEPMTAFQVNEGSLFAGLLGSLNLDDGDAVEFFNDSDNLFGTLTLTAKTMNLMPSELRLNLIMGAGRYGLAQSVTVKNQTNQQWQQFDGRIAPPNLNLQIQINSNSQNYIMADGRIMARIQWSPINDEDPSQDGWVLSVEQAYWEVFF